MAVALNEDVYRALDTYAGDVALAAFEADEWGGMYPAIAQSRRRAWSEAIPF